MNLFIKNDERVHFNFSDLNFVGETGITLIFAPDLGFQESEIKYIRDSLMKIFPLIGKNTVSEFCIYNEEEDGFPKSFTSRKFYGIEGFLEMFSNVNFIEKE